MNLLQLANDFILESESNDLTGSAQGDDFELQQLVMWIRDAWIDIQASRQWNFRWAEGSFTTQAGKSFYTKEELGIGSEAEFDESYVFVQEESGRAAPVKFVPYSQLRMSLKRHPMTGAPRYASVSPAGELILYPSPSTAQTVHFEYYKEPEYLVADTDEPNFPKKYHKIITWKALENYAREQGNEWKGLYQAAIRNYNKIYSLMLDEETGTAQIVSEF